MATAGLEWTLSGGTGDRQQHPGLGGPRKSLHLLPIDLHQYFFILNGATAQIHVKSLQY